MSDFRTTIHCFDQLPKFPRPIVVGQETRHSVDYRFDGRTRRDIPHVIFQYTLTGQGVFRDEHGAHRIPPGRGFLCESRDAHTAYYYPANATMPWQFIHMAIIGDAAFLMARDLIARFGHLFEIPPEHAVIRRLLAFGIHHQAGCIMTADEGLKLSWDLFSALYNSRQSPLVDRSDQGLVRQVHDFIHADPTKQFTISELAKRLHMSREHLSRVFKQKTGLTPHQYQLAARMLTACSLLKAEGLSIKEVATRLGYDTTAHFSRTFHRIMRLAPGQFRQNGILPKTLAECIAARRQQRNLRQKNVKTNHHN